MLRPAILFVLALSMLLAACDPDCECAEYEPTEVPSLSGTWGGTYDVSFHNLMFSNDLTMTWRNDRYELTIDRSGIVRVPFYRTDPFIGEGPLRAGQKEFAAAYSPVESWVLAGTYSVSEKALQFSGRVLVDGRDRGSFRMIRPRVCLREYEPEDVCPAWGEREWVGDDSAEPDEPDAWRSPLKLAFVGLSPNPVSAGTSLTLNALVTPGALHEWTVSLSPATAPSEILQQWTHRGSAFAQSVSAPAEPGDYDVRFQIVSHADSTDVIDVMRELTVSPP